MENEPMTTYRPFRNLDGSVALGNHDHARRFDRRKAKRCGRTIQDETVFRTRGGKYVFFNRDSRTWDECSTGADE